MYMYLWYLHLIYYFYTVYVALQIVEDDAKQKNNNISINVHV